MQEFYTACGFASVVVLRYGGAAVGNVLAECFGGYAEDDCHVGDFEVDGGVLLDLL